MGRLKLITLVLGVLCSIPSDAFGYNINTDTKTIGWLSNNITTQTASNELQNTQVDSIKKKQTKLAEQVLTILLNKELMFQTYQNVSGFKQESRYYKNMVAVGRDIVDHSVEATKAIYKSKLVGKTNALLEVSGLVTNAIGLGKAFADIVTNSKVPNPIKHPDAMSGGGDGHNLLNRQERLRLANDILVRLRSIDQTLQYIIFVSYSSNLKDLVRRLDRESYNKYIMANVHINEIIGKWNALKK